MHRAAPYCYTGMKSRRSIGGKVWSGGSRGKEDYHGKHRNRGRQGCHNPLHAFARSHIFWWHFDFGRWCCLELREVISARRHSSRYRWCSAKAPICLPWGNRAYAYTASISLFRFWCFERSCQKSLFQIPFAFAFRCLIDLFDFVLGLDFFWFCHDPSLLTSCIMFTIGITLIGIGVSAMVAMNFVLNPADGCTQAFMKITHLPFGKAKIINDVLRFSNCCVMALAMMGHLFGVGVGTVFSMVAWRHMPGGI